MLQNNFMKKDSKSSSNLNTSFEWGSSKDADSIRTMSSHDLKKSFHKLLEGKNLKNGVWVFGYGSLMWNPDFNFSEKITGTVSGYHRRLCLKSTVYRGSPDNFGLVFGLELGGVCQGIVFHISADNFEKELQTVWEREMFAETYIPTWVNVETQKNIISAITFVINSRHKHYVPNLPIDKVAERVISAKGICGSCHDYVRNTINFLDYFGLHDPMLEDLSSYIKFNEE